ncbi:MAG: hypothetical protein AAFV72_22525 [Cyanobacteria bacterium J06635_1]
MPLQPYFSGFDPLPFEIRLKLMPEAGPQHLQPNNGSDAVVICLHGFTGIPYEVGSAVNAIANHDLTAVAPLLPDHGYRERSEQAQ